jgi:hypothetical protein
VDTAGCILQGDMRAKVMTPGTEKNMVEKAVQTSTMERLCKLYYIPVQGSCLISNRYIFSSFPSDSCINLFWWGEWLPFLFHLSIAPLGAVSVPDLCVI